MTSKMKVAGLRAALEAAGADTTGKKAILVERLEKLRAEPAKMKVADLRAALEAAGADTTGKKALLVKRLEDVRAAHVEPEPAPKSTSSSSSAAAAAPEPSKSKSKSSSLSSSSAAAAAAEPPVQLPCTGPFAVLPTVLLGEIFAALDVHERCAAARVCSDFLDASRAVVATKRLCLPPKLAKRIDDSTLQRLLSLAVAGGALTHVAVRGAGDLLTPGAFEPLTGCKSLQCIDIRGSKRMSEAVEEDDRMYAVIESIVPFVPRMEDDDDDTSGPRDSSFFSEVQLYTGVLTSTTFDMEYPFQDVYEAWAREAGIDLLVHKTGPEFINSNLPAEFFIYANPDAADELWQAGGRAEVHRRIEALRVESGTGHAAFSFRHFLKDHDELPEHDDGCTARRLYCWDLQGRLDRAAYWRAKALGSRCDQCEAMLVEPSDSMEPSDANNGGVFECMDCSSILCNSCSMKCGDCSASVCRNPSPGSGCNRPLFQFGQPKVVTCFRGGCANTRCATAFQNCIGCDRPMCDNCATGESDDHLCLDCHEERMYEAQESWGGGCSCGGNCGGFGGEWW